jgi:hypothetical protein
LRYSTNSLFFIEFTVEFTSWPLRSGAAGWLLAGCTGWLAGARLAAGCLPGWVVGLLAGAGGWLLVACLGGWVAGWLAGWLAG